MKVSKVFLQDFAYLANRYGWNAADVEEMKEAVKSNEHDGRRYITTLAAAHRSGYQQTAENGYLRLQDWLLDNNREPLYQLAQQHQEAP